MSEESGDRQRNTLTGGDPTDRPNRSTRKLVDYRNSGEGGSDNTEQGVAGGVTLREIRQEREIRGISTESVWGGSHTESWSPQTAQRKTDTVVEGLREVQQLKMAKQEEVGMADLLKTIMEMNNTQAIERERREAKLAEEARIREEEREERAIAREEDRRIQEIEREEKRLQDRQDREENRRREEQIKEDRMIQREAREREAAAEREVQLLATLKAAQPAVPQTIHLDNTKLPVMEQGEDVQVYLELFESALTAGRVPADEWLPKLHAALNTETKLAIKEEITNPASGYEDVKRALIGQTHLTFAAASESLMTLDQGKVTKAPIRQAIQKVARIFEKLTAEATTLREASLYSAVAVIRFALGREAKQYSDIKGSFEWSEFSCAIEEWQRTNPDKSLWDHKYKQTNERVMYRDKQPFRGSTQTKKQGECYACGKYGHYASECRSRIRDRLADVPTTQTVPIVKKEQVSDRKSTQRPLADTTCFSCHQKGHISPNCPSRKNRVKKVKVQEEKIETLKINEVFGAIGPHRMPITLDTGAEVTVVPEETVLPDQFTGENRVLKSFNNDESSGKVCVITISIGDTLLQKEAVTQPGTSLGWSACLSLNLADEEERQILMTQIARRAAMSEKEIRYLPPEVREGVLVSGVPINEAKVVKRVDKNSSDNADNEPVQPDATGAQEVVQDINNSGEVVVDEVSEDKGVVSEKSLVMGEVDEQNLEGSAGDEVELPVASIREGMPRQEMAEQTATDDTLQAVRKLAELEKEGFHMSQGLIWRTRLEIFGKPNQQLCVPAGFRHKCLTAAHGSFGHQGRNKMVQLLRLHFYWPNQSRSCRNHVKECARCQTADKTVPKPHSMTPRPTVTQPFSDVAIDLVGPFPTATGGFQHMLTCVDSATRWPEAIPLRSTTSTNIIRTLTEVFSRTGFPEKLTSDNGPQFSSKEFTSWLTRHGITHSRSTPYHPQGNGVVERLHRTLNSIILKTVEAKGNWARVLPLALYFIRCTPASSTGFSPFVLTHGWEPRTPLQVLYQSWVKKDLENIDLSDWIRENQERIEQIRDTATGNQIETTKKRQERWNRHAKDREFNVGDRVWVRRPGLDHKLQESWAGPGTIVKCNSPVSFKIQMPDRLIPTIHIQQIKPAAQETVKKITAVVQDTAEEDLIRSIADTKIQSEELTQLQQAELQAELDKYADVLTKDPGLTSLTKFDIDTGDATPFQQRPYSTQVTLKESVNKELEWLLQKGYIVPSSSPWSSPMVTVRKPDSSARICVDFRRVNSLMRQQPFFMPRVEEVIEGIGKARFNSKLDLSKGFYEVWLTDEAMPKTAFTCHKGAYHFTRMPFGVKNAPACFQSLMQKVLAAEGEFATPYMDDVVIFSSTWDDHIAHVGRVLQAIRSAGLTVNPNKCSWGGRAVEFLGHYVGRGEMTIPAHRTTALRTYTKPRTKKGLRAFLGSVGFYRRYLPKLAHWTAVLTPMTSRAAPQMVEWTGEGTGAFNHICSFFCAIPTYVFLYHQMNFQLCVMHLVEGWEVSYRYLVRESGRPQHISRGSYEGRRPDIQPLSLRPWRSLKR